MPAFTKFELHDSPFRNIFSFSTHDLASYLEPHFRSFLGQALVEKGSFMPPGAFLFSKTTGCHLSSYNYESPEVFSEALRSASVEISAILSVSFSAVGSIMPDDSSAYLLLHIQTPDTRVRSAMDINSPRAFYDVTPSWGIRVGEDQVAQVLGGREVLGDLILT